MIFDIIETNKELIFKEVSKFSIGDVYHIAECYSIEYCSQNNGPWIGCYNGYENALIWEKQQTN